MDQKKYDLFNINEIELHYSRKVNPKDRPEINSSKDAYDIFLSVWDLKKIELIEQFSIMLLDKQSRCIGVSNISTGGTMACIVDPKILFSIALKSQAVSIILAHNHPSGCVEPSPMDIEITETLMKGAKLLGLYITDHLIIAKDNYHSIVDKAFKPHGVKWAALAN